MSTLIDLSAVRPPDAVHPVDYEDILSAYIDDLVQRLSLAGIPFDTTGLEFDPLIITEQARAYREVLVRQRINDAVLALLLASSRGADLDQLASDFGLLRRVLVPATDTAPAVMEDDRELRLRRQLAPDALASGTAAGYRFAALNADTSIRDARAVQTAPGVVRVALLSRFGSGSVDADTAARVAAAMGPEATAIPRLMTDTLYVQAATIALRAVSVRVFVEAGGPGSQLVTDKVRSAILTLNLSQLGIGAHLRRSTISGAAYCVGGVLGVDVISPTADTDPGNLGAVYIPSVAVEVSRVNE